MTNRNALSGAHITIVLAGLGAGGAERVVGQLAERWVKMAERVTIVTFDGADSPIYHPLPAGVRVERLGIGAGVAGIARRVAALRGVLKRDRPDVVLSFLTKINAIALLATADIAIPVIAAERNNPEQQHASRLWNLALGQLYGQAAAIVCQTRASVRCIPRRWRSGAVVIPNPVRRYPVEPAEPKPHVIAAVGRLTVQKGFDLLLDAFAEVATKHPSWELHIWGDGPDRAALERQAAELGLGDKVRFRGVSRQPGGWIAEAGVFVLSSRFEGFPNVLGEAMAAGLPVLATRCDFGPEEIVSGGEDGLLVDLNVRSLAVGLDRLLSDEAFRNRLGTAARSVETRFSAAHVLPMWDEVVCEALAGQSGVLATTGFRERSPPRRPVRG